MYRHVGQKFAATTIDKAHRIVKKIKNKPRPITARIKTHYHKEFTFSFKATLARVQIYVNLHLPDEQRFQNTLLHKVCSLARKSDNSSFKLLEKKYFIIGGYVR